MDLLLDTHALIWFLEGDENLGKNALEAITNPHNTCYVSVASLWEMAIKISLGKLDMQMPFNQLMQLLWENGINVLSIQFSHTVPLIHLPFHHRDPFDRMLLAQAITDNMCLVSKDENFALYEVKTIW